MTLRDLCHPLWVGAPVGGGFCLASFDEDRASVVLAKGTRLLGVRVGARDDTVACFQTTRSFNLVYFGLPGQPLERDEYEALWTLASILRRNDTGEALMPPEPPTGLVRLARRLRDAVSPPAEAVVVVDDGATTASLVQIETAARLRPGRIALHGTDPLRHPRAVDLVREARRLGVPEVEIFTPGERLKDRALADALIMVGATRFHLVLDAERAQEVEATARMLVARGADFAIVMPASRANLGRVIALGEWAALERWPFRLGHADAEPERYREQIPSYAEVVAAVAGAGVVLDGFPPCVTARAQSPMSPTGGGAYAEPCAGCSARARCRGATTGYLAGYGSAGLEPLA